MEIYSFVPEKFTDFTIQLWISLRIDSLVTIIGHTKTSPVCITFKKAAPLALCFFFSRATNRTESATKVWFVIIRVMNNIGRTPSWSRSITRMILEWIGRHKVLLPIYQNCYWQNSRKKQEENFSKNEQTTVLIAR